jgi:integrase
MPDREGITMPVVNLATVLAEGLVCPEGRSKVEFVSHERSGLYILVSAATPGVGTYFVRYKRDGKTMHHKLGRSNEIDLETARQKTRELKAQLVLGQGPHADKGHRRALPTLDDFVNNEYTGVIKSRKRTWEKDLERYRVHIAPYLKGNTKLDTIKKPHIQSLHTAVREKGLSGATADHVLKVIRQILNLAVDYEYIDKNPAIGVKQYNEDNRVERYLDEEELQRLLQVLTDYPNRVVAGLVTFLLSTGARLQEACQAEVADISLENRVWRIPAIRTKSKKIRSIPLNDTAVRVIDELDIKEGQEYLFINPRTKKPYTTIHRAFKQITHRAKLEGLRIHDLRHSFISYLLQNGRTLYEAQIIAGHSSSVVTERYAHLSMQTLHDAANTASAVIEEATKQGD